MKEENKRLLTKEMVKKMEDGEILKLVQEAAGFTSEKKFKEKFNADFTYSFLTSTLKGRGYVCGWHKEQSSNKSEEKATEIIKLKKSEGNVVRKSYMMNADIAEQWDKFLKNIPYKTIPMEIALMRFLHEYKEGKIKLELDIEI